ncbi:MAG: hypothetical protein J1E81_09240 [Eubacterium sp.]|nr:hypothetical protein [Eubacterium sp.]
MKNKKEKIKKPTELKIKCAKIFKEYLKDYAAKKSCIVEFEPESYEYDFSLECTIRYNDFTVVIKYFNNKFLPDFDIDFYFVYENSDEHFSIYDIFNLFDIKDFNYYFYNHCIDENSIVKALSEITGAIYKYYYDIKKAGNQEYLPRLVWQCKDDKKKANGKEIPEGDLFDFSHIIYRTTTAKTKEKLIKKLEKAEADDELLLYEKRLLQYLRNGYDVKYSSSQGNESDKIFRRIRIKVNSAIFLACAAVVTAIVLISYKVNFSGAYVPFDEYFLGVPVQVTLAVAAAITISILPIITIGRKISIALCTDDVKGYARAFYKDMNGETKIDKIVNKVLTPIGAAVMAVFFLLGATINIGFFDDYFKIYYFPTSYDVQKYDDVEFARVIHQGSADDYEEFEGVCYAILWEDNYYLLDECDELNETDKMIKDIAYRYQKEIKEIDNIDVLHEMYPEETE